jgi:predicted phosphoribosyltransferase
MIYSDRTDAGRRLALELERFRGARPLVYGLPRGGIPVAYETALALGAPLQALPVRKVGLPWYPELAMGAVAPGARVILEATVAEFGVTPAQVEAAVSRELKELERRRALYCGGRPRAEPRGRTALVIDDGLATGATMAAAVRSLRARGAARIVAAVPVASQEARDWLASEADEVVCLEIPRPFSAVGQWYARFEAVPDEEVLSLLQAAVTTRSNPICEGQTPPRRAWGTMKPGG